ncbi:hypothetical protein Q1695_004449 [Nippostrongylus brasiliensis]|nr:hypothetical protein Q1695_004449 [Nippostrongylus brasiliensis]
MAVATTTKRLRQKPPQLPPGGNSGGNSGGSHRGLRRSVNSDLCTTDSTYPHCYSIWLPPTGILVIRLSTHSRYIQVCCWLPLTHYPVVALDYSITFV